MAEPITRREFVATTVAGAAMAGTSPVSFAADRKQKDYSFLLLGDTHFDRKEHHDFEWMKEHFAKDIAQVESYCRHTTEKLPGLLKHAREQLRRTDSPAFALHVGDLVEGICGNEKLASQHCSEAWDFFKAAEFDVPLLMTKGNHDVTGPGSAEAYEQTLLPATTRELGREKLDRTSYSFMRGNDLYAAFDAYDRSAIDWLEELVRTTEFRRLFVLLHMPVVPYNARSNWRVYYHPAQAERRQRLVDLLGQHHAIVLCGHLHKYSLLVRRCRTGSFTQLAISSVLKDLPTDQQHGLNDVSDYGATLTNLEPGFSQESLEARQQILSSEKPFIEHFEYSHNSGFAVVSVTDEDVRAEVYSGVKGALPWKTVSLAKHL